ncbi:hypothetical protein K458DRAFT_183047 [Lentithecium fluviatile CBS 122367]|uniref:Uncharacterized protein n=1 Tax=Lentithecium fluviatile CBS 122367 TaxID=1168545 RepID=A0A6G1IDU8_9PLEO|nr:hypothetical protein K458DRAFT_183047 [Lentithecium fluviatile CBS 122367]
MNGSVPLSSALAETGACTSPCYMGRLVASGRFRRAAQDSGSLPAALLLRRDPDRCRTAGDVEQEFCQDPIGRIKCSSPARACGQKHAEPGGRHGKPMSMPQKGERHSCESGVGTTLWQGSLPRTSPASETFLKALMDPPSPRAGINSPSWRGPFSFEHQLMLWRRIQVATAAI